MSNHQTHPTKNAHAPSFGKFTRSNCEHEVDSARGELEVPNRTRVPRLLDITTRFADNLEAQETEDVRMLKSIQFRLVPWLKDSSKSTPPLADGHGERCQRVSRGCRDGCCTVAQS